MRKKTEAMRQTLLEAATTVFLERGFNGTLMSDISNRANCSKGTLYSYFTSKDALFFEVVLGCLEREFVGVISALDPSSSNSLEEDLLNFGTSFLSLLYSPRVQALRRLTICSASDSDIGHRVYEEGVRRYQSIVAEFLLSAMKQGKLRQEDPHVAAAHLCGLLDSEIFLKFLLRVLDELAPDALAEIAKRAVDVFLVAYRRLPSLGE